MPETFCARYSMVSIRQVLPHRPNRARWNCTLLWNTASRSPASTALPCARWIASSLDDVGVRHRKRQDAHRHHLEFLAHVVDLADLARLQIAHDRAAVRDPLDDAHLFQFEQREPDVAAMGVEIRAQVLLDQPLARVPAAEHDVFLELSGRSGRRSTARAPRPRSPRATCREIRRVLARGAASWRFWQSPWRNLPFRQIVYNLKNYLVCNHQLR